MSVTLWLALVLQFTSVALLRLGLGKMWLRRPVTLLVLASVVYDASQVLLSFPSVAAWDSFRNGIAPGYEADAALLLSAAMLALAAGFLFTGRGQQEAPRTPDAAFCARVLDWRVLAVACAPLAVLTYEGRGYNGHAVVLAPGTLSSPGVASAFFVAAVTLTAVSFLLRHGAQWFVPVLAAQSLLLAAAGERTPVLMAALALGVTCARAGHRPSRRQVLTAMAVTVLAVAAVTGARAVQGRRVFNQDTGLQARLTALGETVTGTQSQAGPGLVAQAATRLDGTSFTAGILQARAAGYPLLDPSAIPHSLLLAVPKALWPGKPDAGNTLDPYQAQIAAFGLSPVNFLAGVPGLYTGYLSPAWLLAVMGLAGAGWGLAERWMLARVTPARLVLLAGSVLAAGSYEGGLPSVLVSLRAAAVIASCAWLVTRSWRQPALCEVRDDERPAAPPVPPAPDVQVPPVTLAPPP
jgi:hypothetical protein